MNILDYGGTVCMSLAEHGGPWIEIPDDGPLVLRPRARSTLALEASHRRRAERKDLPDKSPADDPTLTPLVRDAHRRRLAELNKLKGQQ